MGKPDKRKNAGRSKHPIITRAGSAKEVPRSIIREGCPHFIFSRFDNWQITAECGHSAQQIVHDVGAVFQKLREYECRTWNEIVTQSGNRDHGHFVKDILPLARERLRRIRLFDHDDIDDERLFRFRFGGTQRVWGQRQGADFHVLWWDPNHLVYPLE